MNILIADSNTLVREGIKSILISKNWTVNEVNSIKQVYIAVKKHLPSLLLLEINLCDISIKHILQQINSVSPNTQTLIISDCNCDFQVMLAITAGISGFIGKSVEKNELLQAIEVIAKGKKYFSQEITSIITEHYYTMKNSNFELTERENEILKYIGRGRSNEQIGDLLNLSEKTVATHKRNVMKKIGVKKTSELILWALDNGIISKRII